MYKMNDLFKKGRALESSDVRDPYTYLAHSRNLDNYRIYTLASLVGEGSVLKKGIDVPEYAYNFIAEQGECLGIANVINGIAYSIVFKSLNEKKFLTAGDKRTLPYGIGSFDESFEFGDWVVVVEGLKDRDSLASIYPNVVASQTAGLGMMAKKVLLTLTNRFVLFYDNSEMDDAGRRAFYRDRRFFSENGAEVRKGIYPEGIKDAGELVDLEWRGDFFQSHFYSTFLSNQFEALR